MAILILLLIVAVTLVGIAWHRAGYWQRRGISGPTSRLFIGALDRLYSHTYPNLYRFHDWICEFGPIVGFQRGWINGLVIADPEAAREVFVEKFEYFHHRDLAPLIGNPDTEPRIHLLLAGGKRWKRLRALASPAFSLSNMKKILPTLDYCATETVHWFEKAHAKSRDFNVTPYFFEYTMDTICRLCMGPVDNQQHAADSKVPMFLRAFDVAFGPVMQVSWIFPPIGIVIKRIARKKHPHSQMINFLYKVIDERKQRRAEGEMIVGDKADFIDIFLNAETDQQVENEQTTFYDKTNVQVSKQMTTEEIMMACNIFLLAGFDTTANSLALTTFYFARYPEIQERVWQEISEVCRNPTPTYEELSRLKYVEALTREVLRFHPIAQSAVSRRCMVTTKLCNGLLVEKGTDVIVDLLSIHFDKKTWGDDAEEFRPERFLQDKIPSAYYAFGGGPRLCIGMRFAFLEEKLLLVYFLRKFRVVATENTPKEIKLHGIPVLSPVDVTVRLEERSV
ncbi:putative cytochrome P450 CYP13A8 [Aphelenchoides besseyi]|nr:putative cytochrome P450 CYP13A8 [Aphelenchoides besseyi]